MGKIKIGSSKDKKGIEINPNVVLFNGNNVKKIISNATEIWADVEPIALVPTLSSNSASDGGYAFCSAEHNSSYASWKAFNGITSSYQAGDAWVAPDYVTSGYIGYKFVKPTCVKKFSLTNRYSIKDNVLIHAPKEIMLMASNDGSTWEGVSKVLINQNVTTTNWFEIDNSRYYLYYKLHIFNSYGSSLSICELQFYGNQLN